MRKLKKFTASVLALLLGTGSLAGFAACGDGEQTINNDTTVNIKVIKQGYGVAWLYELETQFETAFAEEGYQVNILEPSEDYSGSVVVNELYQGYNEIGVDLYITAAQAQNMGIHGEYNKVLVEDIRESVYNMPAIGYDGEEESLKISEKLSKDVVPFMCDDTGAMYGFNWVQAAAGMVVNTKKLAKYGVTELPRTTNEMFDIFEKIYLGANGQKNSYESTTYPITYFAGANGYQLCMLMVWLAQYDPDFYQQFWTMEDAQGNPLKDNGYELFNHPAITDMLTLAHRTFDLNIAAYGSTTQGLDQAQAKIMKEDGSDAVFYAVGDWMINEVKLNYRNYLNDVEFMNFPVTSALGTKTFGAGTKYNLSVAKCDEVLSHIIKLVDENKTVDEIVTSVFEEFNVTIDEADALKIAKARGTYYTRGVEQMAYITKDAVGKEVAAKFLRMMASEDFAVTFSNLANATTPYTSTENTTTRYKFVNQASKIAVNDYVSLISHRAKGFRKELDYLSNIFVTVSHIPSKISTSEIESIWNDEGGKSGKDISVYEKAAKAMQKAEYDNAKANWSKWLSSAGY